MVWFLPQPRVRIIGGILSQPRVRFGKNPQSYVRLTWIWTYSFQKGSHSIGGIVGKFGSPVLANQQAKQLRQYQHVVAKTGYEMVSM